MKELNRLLQDNWFEDEEVKIKIQWGKYAYNNKWVIIEGKPFKYAAVYISPFDGIQRLIHHQHCTLPQSTNVLIPK
jgi:hypothetical protein